MTMDDKIKELTRECANELYSPIYGEGSGAIETISSTYEPFLRWLLKEYKVLRKSGEDIFDMPEKPKVKSINQTCDACPSQWEGYTEDNQYIYIRYRWGYLSVTLDDQDCIFGEQVGGEFDGIMNSTEMMRLTKNVLDWEKWLG